MKTIQPAPTQIFAEPIKAEKTTASGFIITQEDKYEPKFANIVNVGEAVKGYKQHDSIVYREYASTDIELDGESYILINVDDVLGKVLDV